MLFVTQSFENESRFKMKVHFLKMLFFGINQQNMVIIDFFDFYAPEGRHIVIESSVRLSVRPSVRLSVPLVSDQ